MSTATLTSLAILRVNLDEQRGDYLENLRPFILQVLFTHHPDPVTDVIVADYIRADFGLVIPSQSIQRLLRRLVDDSRVNIQERYGKIQIVGKLEDPAISDKQEEVECSIRAILDGLQEFSQTTNKPMGNSEDAITAVTTFLSQFDVTCLSAYVRRTAIPPTFRSERSNIILTSDYVQHLQETDLEMFERFLVLVKGHMLANALMCPNLDDAPSTYENIRFYLDTPLLVHLLGFESKQEETATRDLVDLVRKLGGEFAVFTHTLDELETVVKGAAQQVEDNDPWMPIAYESIRRGKTPTQLRLDAMQMEDRLKEMGIITELTPPYNMGYQIDELELGRILDEKIGRCGYRSDQSKSHDINSVRSIYVVRRDEPARSLEKSRAVLLTSNGRFAQAAWVYGRTYLASQHVSTVITDFSLANLAWLKTPVEADDVPITQMLAFSYAALRPPNDLWRKYLLEIDRLEEEGVISQDQHILMRSYELTNRELMRLTLGEDAALKDETVMQAAERITEKIRGEADFALEMERDRHKATLDLLGSETHKTRESGQRILRWCAYIAGVFSWAVATLITFALVAGMIWGVFVHSTTPVIVWAFSIAFGGATIGTLLGLLFGWNLKDSRAWLQDRISSWMFNIIARALAIDIRNPDRE